MIVTLEGLHVEDDAMDDREPAESPDDVTPESVSRHLDEVIAGQSNMEVGIVKDSEADLRDVVMLYQVEERKAAKRRHRQLQDIVASLGGDSKARHISSKS